MADQTVRFENGANYERYMGKWSQLVGATFISWLAPKQGWRWLDVGCGNGAFTDTIVSTCQPKSVVGIDPSEGQLAFARTRSLPAVEWLQGDAMALPYEDNSFDVAVMPLVIFFVPDPVKGVSEMQRVVRPSGIVSAYSWDMIGGGFPYAILHEEMRALGVLPATAPSLDASRIDVMHELWTNAGLHDIETRAITVERTFADFDDYWATVLGGPSVSGKLAAMSSSDLAGLKDRLHGHFHADVSGRITFGARANAIRGYKDAGPRPRR